MPRSRDFPLDRSLVRRSQPLDQGVHRCGKHHLAVAALETMAKVLCSHIRGRETSRLHREACSSGQAATLAERRPRRQSGYACSVHNHDVTFSFGHARCWKCRGQESRAIRAGKSRYQRPGEAGLKLASSSSARRSVQCAQKTRDCRLLPAGLRGSRTGAQEHRTAWDEQRTCPNRGVIEDSRCIPAPPAPTPQRQITYLLRACDRQA